MLGDPEAPREALHNSIQGIAGLEDTHGEAPAEGAVLLGWVVVAEWALPTGRRMLSRIDGSATGEPLPPWTQEGYLHNGLYGDWRDQD